MSVIALGYIVVEASDTEAWRAFAVERLGTMPTSAPEDCYRFRTDGQLWRISVEPGPLDDLAVVGFEVAGPERLQTLKQRLIDAGIEVEVCDKSLADDRGVMELITCRDPDGLRLEFYHQATILKKDHFVSPVGVSAFIANEEGLGHIVITAKDVVAMRDFYTRLLGFDLSDIIVMKLPGGPIDVEFYHCNRRHHTLALAPMDYPKRLHHFLLQVAEIDDLGRAIDRANEAGDQMSVTLGRHSNDRNLTVYLKSPSGFEVEYGWGGPSVDKADRRSVRFVDGSSWGHRWLG